MPCLIIDNTPVSVEPGTTVAVAVLIAGWQKFRRGPLCGMGICFECRVTIDGAAHTRSCQIVCEEGMRVTTT